MLLLLFPCIECRPPPTTDLSKSVCNGRFVLFLCVVNMCIILNIYLVCNTKSGPGLSDNNASAAPSFLLSARGLDRQLLYWHNSCLACVECTKNSDRPTKALLFQGDGHAYGYANPSRNAPTSTGRDCFAYDFFCKDHFHQKVYYYVTIPSSA